MEKKVINVLLERIIDLEERVATLEGQVQEQPLKIDKDEIVTSISNLSKVTQKYNSMIVEVQP